MTRWEWALLAAVAGVSLAILGSVSYLPMNDAPSHLGTAVIALQLLKGDPFFASHYAFSPVPVPYWATTLLVTPLIPLLGPLPAFAVVVGAYVLLLPASFYFLMRTAAPENVRLTAVAALCAFNWSYWLGETNYFLGLPAFLSALALFLRIPSSGGSAVAGFLAAVAACYACHIYSITALLAAVFALAVLGVAGRFHAALAPWRLVRGQWIAIGLVMALFAAGAYVVVLRQGSSRILHHGYALYGLIFDWRLQRLAHLAADPFQSPTQASPWPAFAFSTVVGAILVGSAIRGLRAAGADPGRSPAEAADRPLRSVLNVVNPLLLVPSLVLVGLFCLGPVRTVREGEIAQRFLLPGFLLALGAVRFRPGRLAAVLLAAAVAVFGSLKLAGAWRLHRDFDAVATAVSRDLLSRIPERSRVVPVMDLAGDTDVPHLYHRLANYAVVERHSYSANIMATPGQQAVRHLRQHTASGAHRVAQRSPSNRQLDESDWEYFDYVLVQSERERPDVPQLEERATLVGRSGAFRLYRVVRGGEAGRSD